MYLRGFDGLLSMDSLNILGSAFHSLFPVLASAGAVDEPALWESPASMFYKLASVIVLILLNGFFVAAEFAIVKVRKTQLEAVIEKGARRNGQRAKQVIEHLDEYLSATQLGITLSSIGLGWLGHPFVALLLYPVFGALGIESQRAVEILSFGIAFGGIAILHIVVGELLPKSIAIRHALPITLYIAGPLRIFYLAFRPIILLLNSGARFLLVHVLRIKPATDSELGHSEEELRVLLSEGERSDEVSQMGRELVENALDLKHLVVRDIMTPRNDVVLFDLDDAFDAELQQAIESHYTRFPLCREHLDNAVGVIHIKDLLKLVIDGSNDVERIKRETLHVSEMLPLEKLLRTFLKQQAHLAVVVDEYGGAVGIVTLDNVLEELVGSIQDEFDTPEEELRQIGDGEFEVEGTHALHDLEDVLDHEFPETGVSTIGGFLTTELGHLPAPGERVRIGLWVATVVETDGRRVLRVHLKSVVSATQSARHQPQD